MKASLFSLLLLIVSLNPLLQAEDMSVLKTNSNETVKSGNKLRHLAVAGADTGAIKFLKDKLFQITGKNDFTIHNDPDEIIIHVGKDEAFNSSGLDFNSMHPYGYYIMFKNGKDLILCGDNPKSNMYAVCDFLKRYAGYRVFGNGELSEILPPKKAIELPGQIDSKEEPSIKSYCVASNYSSPNIAAFGRNSRLTVVGTHAFYQILPVGKYYDEHPEYYAEVNGSRLKLKPNMTGTWQPCLKNPVLLGLCMDYSDKYVKDKPLCISVPFGVNDGGGDCQCAYCKEQLERYGNQYVSFYNAVARELKQRHPDKLLSFLAYGRCASPAPTGIKLESNILPEVASGMAGNFQELEKWKNAGARYIGIYDYMYTCGSRRYIVPRYYPKTFANAWRKVFKNYNLTSLYIELYPSSLIFEAPRQYVLDEVAWNTDADIEALLNDYFISMYAEASVPIKAAFERLEEIYARKKDPLHPMADTTSFSQSEEYTLDDLDFIDGKMDEAVKSVKDSKAKARLAILVKFYNFVRGNIEAHVCARALSEADQDKIIPLINRALEAIRRCDDFQLSPSEDKEVFCGKQSLAEYRKTAVLRPEIFLEGLVDKALCRITKDEAFWRREAGLTQNNKLKSWLLTQVYKKNNKGVNLVNNPSFEVTPDTDVSKWAREEIGSKLKWQTWHFQNSVTAFVVSSQDAHSGKYCVGIGENQISGCLQLVVRLEPGCRYSLSFYVKRNAVKPFEDSLGGLSIRFKDAEGKWADEGASKIPAGAIKIDYPPECVERWVKIETTFSALPGNEHSFLSALFAAPRQGPDARLWFDDVELTKVYDPDYLKK